MQHASIAASAGLVLAALVLAGAALYEQRPSRLWEIRWLNFLGAVAFLNVGTVTLLTGSITESRHSVTLSGAPAAVVGSLFILCGAMLCPGSLRRRSPDDRK